MVKKERQFLDEKQIGTFIAALRGKKIETAALLGLHSLRRSEILDLTWDDIDLERGIIHVRGAAVIDKDGKLVHKSENKNASSTRDVPIMIPRLRELLSQGGEGYIVNYRPNAMYIQINRECKKLGLPEVGVHGLRHSFVSLAYHLGWSEVATMRVAGYADYQTMRKIYTHLSEQDRKKDIGNMESFYKNFQ
jgi:integrase